MSRIGKKPISIPSEVTVDVTAETLNVKGPKGELTLPAHPKVKIEKIDNDLLVKVDNENNKQQRALWGLYRALINNMIIGVTAGFTKILEINGVGYKAELNGKKLILTLGYSHPIALDLPAGLEAKVEKNVITISGIDRQQVGQFAAVVRSKREPEPYKGKGIKYQDEVIRRKAGKVVKAVGGGK
jgi:large subunit ribosomal protein L6